MDFEPRRSGLPLRAGGLDTPDQSRWPQIFFYSSPSVIPASICLSQSEGRASAAHPPVKKNLRKSRSIPRSPMRQSREGPICVQTNLLSPTNDNLDKSWRHTLRNSAYASPAGRAPRRSLSLKNLTKNSAFFCVAVCVQGRWPAGAGRFCGWIIPLSPSKKYPHLMKNGNSSTQIRRLPPIFWWTKIPLYQN